MANNFTVGFSNDGVNTHYVIDNTALAAAFGVADVLGSTAITANVTGGALTSPYDVPAVDMDTNGVVDAAYTTSGSYDEAYFFTAQGWNFVKNITVKAEGDKSMLMIGTRFVHADVDFSKVTDDVNVQLKDGKRSNVLTGEGDDRVYISSATNKEEWSNIHKIKTGEGNDMVTIDVGDNALKTSSIVKFTDGRYTSVEADLGKGDDVFYSNNNVKSKDTVWGGKGSDTIYTGAGNDVIYGGEDNGAIVDHGDALYTLLAKGDTLYGGTGADKFKYSTSDGAGFIGDGFDHIVDFANEDVLQMTLHGSDVVTTESATVQTTSGNMTGTMVSVNGNAAVFLEDYFNTAQIFV